MAGYGTKGDMNPQSKEKRSMSNEIAKTKSSETKKGHDMSPKIKDPSKDAIWQNMRG